MHEEPEAQVTQADTGWQWSPGCHLCNVTLSLWGWMYVQEVPSTTFGDKESTQLLLKQNIQNTLFNHPILALLQENIQ